MDGEPTNETKALLRRLIKQFSCTADLNNWDDDLEPGGHIVLHDCYEGNEVKTSILDFIASHSDVTPVNTPYRGSVYWQYPEGSIFHMIKNR